MKKLRKIVHVVEIVEVNNQHNLPVYNCKILQILVFQMVCILFLLAYVAGPLTHTHRGKTTVYGITNGPGDLPDCNSTGIFAKVSAPDILNWIKEVLSLPISGGK